MARVFSRQKRPTLMNQALQEIREAIRKGKLKPGDRLVEMQLADEMQISRFPIREALRYLEKEGLVETKPFKGTYVAQLTERDMEELYSLRSAIEEFAIRILIKHIDAEKIAKFESISQSMQQASKNEDLDKLISEDFRFHQTICELSNHRKLLEVWLTLENQLRVFLTIEKQLFGDSAQFIKSHNPILKAIRERKIRPAQKAIRDHLNWAMQVIRQGYWEKTSEMKSTKGKK
jgi:DNA-binding GntR family transcriptional regulator